MKSLVNKSLAKTALLFVAFVAAYVALTHTNAYACETACYNMCSTPYSKCNGDLVITGGEFYCKTREGSVYNVPCLY
jgi:hypothetical protein